MSPHHQNQKQRDSYPTPSESPFTWALDFLRSHSLRHHSSKCNRHLFANSSLFSFSTSIPLIAALHLASSHPPTVDNLSPNTHKPILANKSLTSHRSFTASIRTEVNESANSTALLHKSMVRRCLLSFPSGHESKCVMLSS